MARPAPEAVSGRLPLVGGVALPDGQLRVCRHLADDRPERERGTDPREPRHLALVDGDEREREREDEHEPGLRLEEDEERAVHVRGPAAPELLVAPVLFLACEPREQVGAEANAPDRAEPRDEDAMQRRAVRQQRVGDGGAGDPERPRDVDVARVVDPDRHEPDADHRCARTDRTDEKEEPRGGHHSGTVFAFEGPGDQSGARTGVSPVRVVGFPRPGGRAVVRPFVGFGVPGAARRRTRARPFAAGRGLADVEVCGVRFRVVWGSEVVAAGVAVAFGSCCDGDGGVVARLWRGCGLGCGLVRPGG